MRLSAYLAAGARKFVVDEEVFQVNGSRGGLDAEVVDAVANFWGEAEEW